MICCIDWGDLNVCLAKNNFEFCLERNPGLLWFTDRTDLYTIAVYRKNNDISKEYDLWGVSLCRMIVMDGNCSL